MNFYKLNWSDVMTSFTNILKKVAMIALIAACAFGPSFAAKRVVLLEQHTGAWCGWCVDGSYRMELLLEKYPDQFIGVKFHNGDAMAIPEQNEIGSALGLTGFPTGSLNRVAFNGTKVFLDRAYWDAAAAELLKTDAPVAVSAKYFVDKAAGKIFVTVTANFEKDINDEVRLNAYVIEDSTSGTGSSWDQKNYYSGLKGQEDSPYYSQPNPIVGYQHRFTVRKLLGGSWGSILSAGLVKSGKTATYSFSCSIDSKWNLDRISIVGLVQMGGNYTREILNSCRGEKVDNMASFECTTATTKTFVKALDQFGTISVTLKNPSTASKTFSWATEKSFRTPASWNVALDPSDAEFTLGAGESKTFTLKLTPSGTAGAGDANVLFFEKGKEDGYKTGDYLTVYSKEIDKVHVINGLDMFGLHTMLAKTDTKDLVEINSTDYSKYISLFATPKLIVWNSSENGQLSTSDISALSRISDSKANFAVLGNLAAYGITSSKPAFFDKFGVSNSAFIHQYDQNGQFDVEGIAGDPISDGISCKGQLMSYLIPHFDILDASLASPVMKIKDMDSVFAFRSEVSGQRLVFTGLMPMFMTDANAAQTYVNKMMKWLTPATGNVPVATLGKTSFDFSTIKIDSAASVSIDMKNTGTADLTISDAVVSGDADGVFAVQDAKEMGTIAAGEKGTFKVIFTPKAEKTYTATIKITTNDPANPTVSLAVTGKGVTGTSVIDINNAFAMAVTPNPISTTGTVSYNLTDNAGSVRVYVVNSLGAMVSELYNGAMAAGAHSVSINAAALESGSYSVIANIDGVIARLPIVIVK